MDHQRILADSPFVSDDGSADPHLRSLIAVAQHDAVAYARAVAALGGERVLVPVVARTTRWATEDPSKQTVASGPLSSDKEAEMSVVLIESAGGDRALPIFTGLDSLTRWNAEARPVPVTLDVAARSARLDGAMAMIVDIAGPSGLVIEGEMLTGLAAGHRLMELSDGGFGWAIPQSPDQPN